MDVPAELVTTAIIAAAGLLGGNTIQLVRLTNELKHVKERLPNGEVGVMYKMIKELYSNSKNGKPPQAMQDEWERVDREIRKEQGGAEYDDLQ